jgi:hypothetical protein
LLSVPKEKVFVYSLWENIFFHMDLNFLLRMGK